MPRERGPRHEQGGGEGERDTRSRVGSERVSGGEGIRGHSAVVKKQELTVNRKRSRSGSIEPAQQTAPEDEERKGGSKEKDAERKGRRSKKRRVLIGQEAKMIVRRRLRR